MLQSYFPFQEGQILPNTFRHWMGPHYGSHLLAVVHYICEAEAVVRIGVPVVDVPDERADMTRRVVEAAVC